MVLKKIFNRLNFSKDIFIRFPVVFVFIFLSCAYAIYGYSSRINGFIESQSVLNFFILSVATSTFMSLFLENKNYPKAEKIVFFSSGTILAIIGVFVFPYNFALQLGAVFIGLFFAPFLLIESESGIFIHNAISLLKALIFSLLACAILHFGLLGIVTAINYLFGINYTFPVYISYIIFFGLLPSLALLNMPNICKLNVSKDFSFSKLPSLLVRGILMPLVFIYTLVLYAYFAKIIISTELPKGGIVWIVTIYSALSLFIKMSLICIKNKNKLSKLYEKYFYYILITPVIFMLISIYIRIKEYGVTEDRFLVAFLSLYLMSIIIANLYNSKLHIKYIFLLFSLSFALISFSPLNPTSISAKSQLKRFTSLLHQYKILQDGEVKPLNHQPLKEVRAKFSALAAYISQNEIASKRISKILKLDNATSDNILDSIGIKWASGHSMRLLTFSANFNSIGFYTQNYKYVLNAHELQDDEDRKFIYAKYKNLTATFEDGILSIKYGKNSADFDIYAFLLDMKTKKIDEINDENYERAILKSSNMKLQLTNIIQTTNQEESPSKISSISFYLFFQ